MNTDAHALSNVTPDLLKISGGFVKPGQTGLVLVQSQFFALRG